MVNKKNKKTKIKPKIMKEPKRGFGLFKGFNTISITIIFVLVSVLAAFALIMGLTLKITMDDLSYSATLDSLKKISGFSQAVNSANWQALLTDVNQKINSNEKIVYYVVTQKTGVDKNGFATYKVIDKSIELKDEKKTDWYEYKNPQNINSFTIDLASVAYNYKNKYEENADKYMNTSIQYEMVRPFSIELGDKNLHLGIPIHDSEFTEAQNGVWVGILYLASVMLLVTLFVSYTLAKTISNPLNDMEQTVSKIKDGDLSGRLEMTQYQELNRLVESYNQMANTLQRLYSTLENQVHDRTRELKSAYAELQSTQAMMVHSEKMKSLGELVAGIMHEINNPINFIYGNMTHLSNYSNDLINIIDEYAKYNESLKPEEKESIEKYMEEVDYSFLKSDLPELIKSCKEGANRAKNIIQDLKSFSRMEEVAITDVDIPNEIDTTLNILHNKIKNKAQVHKEYMENVPKIEAFGGQLNQVFMNILDNAVGAIENQGDIWIRINTDNKNLILEIEDNGIGMDEETARKVFDPFFTTKPVGQGTGLGMSITHKIIKNHQGNIKVDSKKGQGTKFTITLPLNIDRESLKTAALSEGENNG